MQWGTIIGVQPTRGTDAQIAGVLPLTAEIRRITGGFHHLSS
jgi:hypothetical protein